MGFSFPWLISFAICVAILPSSTLSAHDYQRLRQPTLHQSDCATNWADHSTPSSISFSNIASGYRTLHVNLDVELTRFKSDYVNFNTRAYNQEVPGPTIKVCPGDRLVIVLTNTLEAGSSNDTNLHVHGMHLPPVGDADNVMPIVKPGGQREYVYDIHTDHPSGTFWYHPHAHGNVNSQLNGMMAGTLIVVDRPTDFPEPLAAMEDLVLILQTICIEKCYNWFDQTPDTLENKYSDMGMAGMDSNDEKSTWPTDLEIVVDDAYVPMNDTSFLTVYVNGQYLPSVDLNVGEYKRLRFVNAIANNLVELAVTKGSKCTIDLLAMDGIYLDEPKSKTVVVVPPGGRADVAIMCAEIGEFYLETDSARSRNKVLGMANQFRVPSQRIVRLNIKDDEDSNSVATRLPSSLPARPSYMENAVGDVSTVIRETNRYSYEFSMWTDSASDMMEVGVNREKFNMSHVNHSMPVGELQEWDLSVNEYEPWSPCYLDSSSTNTDCYTMVHPFHIHATHFQISGMDEHADPENVLYSVGEWRDTIPMFRSNVQIRFMPREYMVGNIFTHCHIASHADWGMAQLVNVYKPRSSASDEGTNTDKDENIGEQGKQEQK